MFFLLAYFTLYNRLQFHFYAGRVCDTFFKTNKSSKPLRCLGSAEVTLQFLLFIFFSPVPFKLAPLLLHGLWSFKGKGCLLFLPSGCSDSITFYVNWPVLQDKLERKLEADELSVSHLGPRGSKK